MQKQYFLLIFALLFFRLSAIADPISLSEFHMGNWDFTKSGIELIGEGTYGQVYSNTLHFDYAFKCIDIDRLIESKKVQPFQQEQFVKEMQQNTEKEISIYEHIQKFVQPEKAKIFQEYIPFYYGYASNAARKFVIIVDKLPLNLPNAKLQMRIKEVSELRAFLTYQNMLKATLVLHATGVNHCDLKPHNMMTNKKSFQNLDFPVPIKLIDFGKSTLNKPCPLATVDFSKPKLVNPLQNVRETRFDDLYSLAVIFMLYETCRQKDCKHMIVESLTNYALHGNIKLMISDGKCVQSSFDISLSKMQKTTASISQAFLWMICEMLNAEKSVDASVLKTLILLEIMIVKVALKTYRLPTNYEPVKVFFERLKKTAEAIPEFSAENLPETNQEITDYLNSNEAIEAIKKAKLTKPAEQAADFLESDGEVSDFGDYSRLLV